MARFYYFLLIMPLVLISVNVQASMCLELFESTPASFLGHSLKRQTLKEIFNQFNTIESNIALSQARGTDLVAIQTAFLTGAKKTDIDAYFESFPNVDTLPRHQLPFAIIAQTAYLSKKPPQEVIDFFSKAETGLNPKKVDHMLVAQLMYLYKIPAEIILPPQYAAMKIRVRSGTYHYAILLHTAALTGQPIQQIKKKFQNYTLTETIQVGSNKELSFMIFQIAILSQSFENIQRPDL